MFQGNHCVFGGADYAAVSCYRNPEAFQDFGNGSYAGNRGKSGILSGWDAGLWSIGWAGRELMAGDDTQKVLCAAVLDAVCKTDLPERAKVLEALKAEEQVIAEKQVREIQKHAASKVQFNTLDVDY